MGLQDEQAGATCVAVTEVNLLWEGRGGRDGIDRKQRYVRVYEVLTDDPNDDEDIAGGEQARALGLPGNADVLKPGSNAFVQDIDAKVSSESPLRWLVTVTYDNTWSEFGSEGQTIDPNTGLSNYTETGPGAHHGKPHQQRDPNPVNWSATYRTSHEQSQEPFTHDLDGNPVVNSAGDPFNPPLMVERSRPVIEITKYLADVNVEWLERFVDSVNLDTWHGRPARYCRMIGLEWESQTVGAFAVWRVTFRIKIKGGQWNEGANDQGQGWDIRLLDVGYQEYTDGFKTTKKLIDPKANNRGVEAPGPWPLDGLGFASDGDPPAFVTYRNFGEEDWSELGL